MGLSQLSEHLGETLIEKHYFSEKQYGVYRMLTFHFTIPLIHLQCIVGVFWFQV